MDSKTFSFLSAKFTTADMARGGELFRGGHVHLEEELVGILDYMVTDGGDEDSVALFFDSDGRSVDWECMCDAFMRDGVCAHCWACLLDADRRGKLAGLVTTSPPPSAPLIGAGYRPPVAALAPEEAAWKSTLSRLGQISGVAPRPPRNVPVQPGEQWIYLWSESHYRDAPAHISILKTRPKKSGKGHTKAVHVTVGGNEKLQPPTPEDGEICRRLIGCRRVDPYAYDSGATRSLTFEVDPGFDTALLQRISDTGRLHYEVTLGGRGAHEGPVTLRTDQPLRLRMEMIEVEQGWLSVRPRLTNGDGGEISLARVLLALPLHALDRSTKTLHPVSECPGRAWYDQWVGMAPIRIPVRHLNEFLQTWMGTPGFPPLDLPQNLRDRVCDVQPVPRLRIRDKRLSETRWVLATLSFGYAGHWVEQAGRKVDTSMTTADGRVIVRKPEAEAAFAERLPPLGIRPMMNWERRMVEEYEAALATLPAAIAQLVQEGWIVEAGDIKHRVAGDFSLAVASGVDWFDLNGSVMFDEFKVGLPDLLSAMRKNEGWVTLADGSRGLLPQDWLKKLGGLLHLGSQEKNGVIRFKNSQAILLDALLAAQPRVDVDAAFSAVRTRLRDFPAIGPADPPGTFTGTLRAYQREGLGWLEFLAEYGFGGCLADDMGLGKTVQVLARLAGRAELRRKTSIPADQRPGPSIVVAPRSLMFNWMAEAVRFCPDLRVLDWSGSDRPRDPDAFEKADLILTTYGVLRSDAAFLSTIPFDYAILDESQAIKNDKTASAKAARLLQAGHRLAMSGTPIENHLGELWSLFEYLNPGLLGSSGKFDKLQAGEGAADARLLLGQALRPFILRRTKEQVATELPARTENTLYCELEGRQRKDYDELRAFYRAKLLGKTGGEDLRGMTMNVLEALLRLRQTACHPGLIDPERGREECAKFELLLPRLQEVIEEGHKVLVFSQFTSLLALLKPLLDKAGIVHEYLDGQTKDRQACVDRFQSDPAIHVFLISLKAGGVGLNLTAADYVFLLDPWWNPASEAQAIDRAHRIGQVRHVMAYRVIAKNTIEERVLELQASKRALADAILSADNSLIRNLKREDLEILLK
ncbi:MAG: DEAD/DEAH box helicase [Kiritimatiellia bacterium]